MASHASKKSSLPSLQYPAGLFDKIIVRIKLEETRQTRKLLFLFVALLFISIATLPLSWLFFVNQWYHSGINYFIAMATENANVFFAQWQNFILSIFESFPIVAIVIFSINLALALFTVRLFLHKKGQLLRYVKHRLILNHG